MFKYTTRAHAGARLWGKDWSAGSHQGGRYAQHHFPPVPLRGALCAVICHVKLQFQLPSAVAGGSSRSGGWRCGYHWQFPGSAAFDGAGVFLSTRVLVTISSLSSQLNPQQACQAHTQPSKWLLEGQSLSQRP